MRPMPRSMLIHAATLQAYTTDAWQTKTLSTVASLTQIRVDPSSKQVIATDGTTKQLTATLYYDVRNSKPTGVTFALGQLVAYGGNTYRAEAIEPMYDARKLHHYEVGLSG